MGKKKNIYNRFQLFMRIGMAIILLYMPIFRGAVKKWSVAPALIIIILLCFYRVWIYIGDKREGVKEGNK